MNLLALVSVSLLWAAPARSPVASIPPGRQAAAPPKGDRAQLEDMLRAFEDALNNNDFGKLKEFLDPGFRGKSITGDDLAGAEQLRGYMARARQIMGQGSTYHIEMDMKDASVDGDRGRASGVTREHIVLPDGKALDYSSTWSVGLAKKEGKWLATTVDTKVDLMNKLNIAAHVVASKIWQAGLNLGRVHPNRPDFDQDNGFHRPDGVDSDVPSPDKKAGAR